MYVVTRTARTLATVLAVFLCVFVAIRLTPGGPAVAMLGQRATATEIARLNERFGWNLPIHQQLLRYLAGMARGDMGTAYMSPGRPPVARELARRFPATIELSVAALILATLIGVSAGIVAACWRNRWPDRLAIALSSLGVSIPVFFLGILLLMLFRNLPGSGRVDVRVSMAGVEWSGLYLLDAALAGRWDLFAHLLRHLTLPALTLASVPTAIVARVTRSSLLETLGADFIRTARAKGAGPMRVLFRHALPAAAVPIVSLLGMQLATLLSGAVLTETVFGWPGIGRYVMLAATRKDYNALQGAVLLLGLVFVMINAAVDLLCAWLDPRVRLREGALQ